MDDPNVNMISREQVLAKFDHARDDFLDAYAAVPDESLGYKPEGDDYTIGYILPHVRSVLEMYSGLLDRLREEQWGAIAPGGLKQPPLDVEVHRADTLAEIEVTHDTVAGKLRELSTDEFMRKAPVTYPDTTEPYPTSAEDIATWLTEHYYEHVPHLKQLVDGWRGSGAGSQGSDGSEY
jgi:hypothetical protein